MAGLVLRAVPMIIRAIGAAGARGGGRAAAGAAAAQRAEQIRRAQQLAADLARAAAASTCLSCRRGPCAAEAAGIPGVRYQGGAHAFMRLPPGDGLDSHHMPAKAISPLPESVGPAIKMEPADHARTASHGTDGEAAAYRRVQGQLIANGRFREAFAMDVANIRSLFGDKYDGAIAQATVYMECLQRNGMIA